MDWPPLLAFPAVLAFTQALPAEPISGVITDNSTSGPVAGVRVTLFSSDVRFFREVRTSSEGRYSFALVPDGRVFCYGGEYTGPGAGAPVLKNAGQVAGCTNVTDLGNAVAYTRKRHSE